MDVNTPLALVDVAQRKVFFSIAMLWVGLGLHLCVAAALFLLTI
jgi:hypothetical protein